MFKEQKKQDQANPEPEKKLNEEIFRRIVEASPTAIVLIDKEGQLIYLNAQTEKLFGYSRDELTGRSVEILIPERFRKKHTGYRYSFYHHPSARPMGAGRDLYGLHKNGTEIPVEIGLSPFKSGDEILTLGSIIDITERKRAEQMFKHVVESSPNGIVLVDRNGIMKLVNLQMENMFGYSRNELLGKSVEMIISEKYRDKVPAVLREYFSSPSVHAIGSGTELFGLRKDNSQIPVEIGLTPIESEQGVMVLGSIINITERIRAEEKKREEAELAEQHSRELIRLAELERFQKLTIGRELKMIELKKEIKELKKRLNEPEGSENYEL